MVLEMAVRKTGTNRQSSVGIFYRIKCGDCGSWYGSKVWHSNDKYRRVIWQCNHKFDDGEKCGTSHLDEETIKELFVKGVNILTTEKDEIAANFQAIKGQLFEMAELEAEQSQLQEELNVVAELIQQCVRENTHVALDQTEYQARYDGLVERFDRTVWPRSLMKSSGTVFNKEDVRFTFKDGTEIKV